MARLQRLLWTDEYNFDDVVLIEGEFVQIMESGDTLRYVLLGLTPKLLLVAEDNMDPNKDLDPEDLPTDDDYDLEDLELSHLYPLDVVKLSVWHKKEHKIKMRMMNGVTQFYEFADNVGREEKWHHWVARIHEIHVDYRGDAGKIGHNLHTDEGSHHDIVHLSADVFEPKTRKRSRALKWMTHFTTTVSETHNDDFDDEGTGDFTLGLPTHTEHEKSVMSVQTANEIGDSAEAVDDVSEQSSDSGRTEGTDDDLTDDADDGEGEELDETMKSQRLRRLVLSVGEFFGVANADAHVHGPFVLRRTASLTALNDIKKAEESQIKTYKENDPFNINREKVTHNTSLPDILEGEATFVEDTPKAAKITHRASLVFAELENDDPNLTPHYVNGHVMLLTDEEVELEQEVERSRQQEVDLSFTTVKKKGKAKKLARIKLQIPMQQTTDTEGANETRHQTKSFKNRATNLFRTVRFGRRKREDASGIQKKEQKKKVKLKNGRASTKYTSKGKRSNSRERRVNSRGYGKTMSEEDLSIKHVDDIDSDSLAREITLIDRDLMIRVRDTELIDCGWTKKDKHYSAPNVTELIEFFERVVNLVATEILCHESLVERTQVLAKFIDVAEKCYKLRNFNSLRSVLAGLQIPPIYRLHDTWNYLKNMYKKQYRMFLELSHLMTDERDFACYHEALDEAMKIPPCMPFFGIFLRTLIAMDTVCFVTRNKKKMKLDIENEDDESLDTRSDVTPEVRGFQGLQTETAGAEAKPEKPNIFSMLATAMSAKHQQRALTVEVSNQSSDLSVIEENDEENTESGKDGKPRLLSAARRRQIRRAILNHARKIRAERMQALADEDATWTGLFVTMVSLVDEGQKEERMEKRQREEKEKQRHEKIAKMIFHHQINAIRYRFPSNAKIRSFLLRAKCNTGRENYIISCAREPPHRGENPG